MVNKVYATVEEAERAIKLSVLMEEGILDKDDIVSDEDIDTYYRGLTNFRRLRDLVRKYSSETKCDE